MSKNTVWVFGDSFSEDVENVPKDISHGQAQKRWEYVNKILNGVPFKVFPRIISDKIGYEYKNYAANGGIYFEHLAGGNSNDQMFYNITEQSSRFRKGDIVFVGFTSPNRYQVCRSDGGIMSVLPNQDMGINTSRYLENYVERDHPYYIYEMLQKFKILETLSYVVGFKIYYWDWGNRFDRVPDLNPTNWISYETFSEFKFFEEIFRENGLTKSTIADESNGLVDDGHWGKNANDLLADIFYPTVKKFVDSI